MRVVVTFADHGFFEEPVENGRFANAGQSHEDYGFLMGLHDLSVAYLGH